MRVGIFSLPLHINYGGIMQAYALQMILEDASHEVMHIQVKDESFTFKVRNACKNIIELIIKAEFRNSDYLSRSLINEFINNNINIRRYKSFKYIEKDRFDTIIVGSDQVWRRSFHTNIRQAFLSFAQDWSNIQRIGYAVSFGTSKIDYTSDEIDDCKYLLNLFKAVSVRESDAVKICRDVFDVDALHVLDPTMLLDVSYYMKFIKVNPSFSSFYVYMMDETRIFADTIKHITKENSFQPLIYNMAEMDRSGIRPTVEEWLSAFYNADFILTDSFHGCVFSILFHKNFAVLDNTSGGTSRIDSLLNLFHLESHRISQYNDVDSILNCKIDWSCVDDILNRERIQSKTFLHKNL